MSVTSTDMSPQKPRLGMSQEHPFPALHPDDLEEGQDYVGWVCRNDGCGRRKELHKATSKEADSFTEYDRLWTRCPYCLTSDLHRMDQLTTQAYHFDKSAVALEPIGAWKQRRAELLAELLKDVLKGGTPIKVKSQE